MKAIIFFLTIVFANSLSAQDWSPILVNEKMNYQHSDSAYISHTIWVESVQLSGNDTIFQLNRIVKNVPGYPEIALRYQPQFFLKQMKKQDDGVYTFSDPESFILHAFATNGESWLFDQDNNITAQVTSLSLEDVFGDQDSVKVISLTDGGEIRLSKNFGILKFPDFITGGYYELAGIQNTSYGESVPDFWDIFDFGVGDVFQFFEDAGDPFGSGFITRKLTITSKEVNSNSFNYSYDGIYNCLYFEAGGGGGISSYTYSDDFNFTDSINHPANYFSGQDYVLPNSYTGNGTHRVFTVARYDVDDETGGFYKNFGTKDETTTPYSADVFYELSQFSDTLYRFEYTSVLFEPCGLMGFGYGGSLGETFRSEGCFEYWSLKELAGYIKDGDTVGTITPDSLLLTGINNLNAVNPAVFVYPNPVDNVINFRFNELNPSWDEFKIEIRNLLGQLVMQQTGEMKESITLNIDDISPGIYIYTIKSNKIIVQQGKLVIR